MTVPLLPCPDVDEIAAFYKVLGFETTYRQLRPNPYVAMRREDLHLHFFGMPGFDPADSYGSCLVLVPDVVGLHRAFAEGMRAAYGKVLISGTPRMTRPRVRRNSNRRTGFSVIDPGGNWIRITQAAEPEPEPAGKNEPVGKLAIALENAVVLGDSKGDPAQAAKILDGALARAEPDEDPAVLAGALAYRAELALALDDTATARAALERARELDPASEELAELAGNLD